MNFNFFSPTSTDPFSDRIRSALTSGQAFAPTQLDEQTPDSDPGRAHFYQTMQDIYAQSPAMDAYLQGMKEAPNPKDYQGGAWNRIAATLSGIGAGLKNPSQGVAVARSVRMQPYEMAQEAYRQKMSGLSAAAREESDTQSERMKIAQAMEDYDIKHGTLDVARFNALTMQKYREAQMDAMRNNATLQFTTDKSGNTVAYAVDKSGKITGKYDLGPSIETSKLEQGNRRLGIEERQAGAAETRANAYKDNLGRGGSQTPHFASPTDQFYAQQMAAESLIRKHPEWADFYDQSTGRIKDAESWGGFKNYRDRPGTTPKSNAYDEFLNAVEAEKINILNQQRFGSNVGAGLGSAFGGNGVINLPDDFFNNP